MKRFPYILCIVFPVFVWACHTSRQTIGEAQENRVHSIDRDLHVVIDSLCRNEWSGLTEWEWTHVDVFDSVRDETVNPFHFDYSFETIEKSCRSERDCRF